MDELEACELISFRSAIKAGIPAIMSSHILFPNIEPNGVPATMSRTIMHGLLRETLGFDGLILSDCMVMDAIRRHYGHGARRRGGDARGRGYGIRFEQCRSPARERCRGARRRRERLDRRAGAGRVCGAHPPCQGAVDTSRRAGERRACRGLRRCRAHGARGSHCGARQGVPGKRKDIFLRLRRLPHDAGLKRRSGGESVPGVYGARFGAKFAVCSKDPDEKEIAELVKCADGAENIIFSSCNAHLFRGQLALAAALAEKGVPMTVARFATPTIFRAHARKCGAVRGIRLFERFSRRARGRILRRRLLRRDARGAVR